MTPSSTSSSSYLTAVVLITRWQQSNINNEVEGKASAYQRFVSMLKAAPPPPTTTISSSCCGKFTYGPTGVSDTAFFRASVGVSGTALLEKVNLIIADIETMNPQNLAMLITTVADYVIVVDVGLRGGRGGSVASPSEAKCLEKLTNIAMPAIIAARATVVGYLRETDDTPTSPSSLPLSTTPSPPTTRNQKKSKKQPNTTTITTDNVNMNNQGINVRVSDLITSVASEGSLPFILDVEPTTSTLTHLPPLSLESFTQLLSHILPPAGTLSTIASSSSKLIHADVVFKFLTDRSDVVAGVPRDDLDAKYQVVRPDDAHDHLPQQQEGQSTTSCEQSSNCPIPPPQHPQMPLLKAPFLLRSSLPFRCVLISHFQQRQVAVMYITQGTLRFGEDSLMAANLYYMGVICEDELESDMFDGTYDRRVGDWGALRSRCRISSMTRFPMGESVSEGEVAYPGEFITIQLRSGVEYIEHRQHKIEAQMMRNVSVASEGDDEEKDESEDDADFKGNVEDEDLKKTFSFLDELPMWSVCGKFPPPQSSSSGIASHISVDVCFPRPVAVAQWSLSNIYKSPRTSTPTTTCNNEQQSGTSAITSTTNLLIMPPPHQHHFDSQTREYTGGVDALSRAQLVGCGQACLHQEQVFKNEVVLDDILKSRQSLFINCGVQNRSIGMEVTYDTHYHLLEGVNTTQYNKTHNTTVVIPHHRPERRAVILFKGRDKKRSPVVAVVVRIVVLQRKLSSFIIAASNAMGALNLFDNRHGNHDAATTSSPLLPLFIPRLRCTTPSNLTIDTTNPTTTSTSPTYLIDVVERMGIVVTTTVSGSNNGEEDGNDGTSSDSIVVEVVQPLGAAACEFIQIATSHELSYQLPLQLLQDLGIFNFNHYFGDEGEGEEGSREFEPAKAFIARAIHYGCPDIKALNESGGNPLEYDTCREPVLLANKQHGNNTPITKHEEEGKPLGVWLLLAASYHLYCEMYTNETKEEELRDDELRDDDDDTIVHHRQFGQLLIHAAHWSAAMGETHSTTAGYMSGRMSFLLDSGVSRYVRVAIGPTHVLTLSHHTRRIWNCKLIQIFPFETMWRALLSNLLKEWERGATREPILWLNHIIKTAMDEFFNITVTVESVGIVWRILRELLRRPGCSQAALQHLLLIIDTLQQDIKTAGTCDDNPA